MGLNQKNKGNRNIVIGDGAAANITITGESGDESASTLDEQEALTRFQSLPTDKIPPPSTLPLCSRIEYPLNPALAASASRNSPVSSATATVSISPVAYSG